MSILPRKPVRKTSLSCGCVPGYFQCKVSQQLWEAYAKIANLHTYGMATNLELQTARAEYEAHYSEMYVEVSR